MSEDTNTQQSAIENLREGNFNLSNVVKNAVNLTVNKTTELIGTTDDINELLTAIKVIETSCKIVNLTPREAQVNVQINAISGFDYIELDEEDIIQITQEEVFDGEIDEEA